MDTEKTTGVQGEVSTGTASADTQATVPPKVLSQDEIIQLIRKETEQSKREIQSAKDRATAEVEKAMRRASIAESTLKTIKEKFTEDDPDTAEKIRLAEYEARDKQGKELEQQARAEEYKVQWHTKFTEKVSNVLSRFDIDPKDKRIDWNVQSTDYLDYLDKITDQASAIHKDNLKSEREKSNKEVAEKIAKERREAGLDSVDISISTGGGKSLEGLSSGRTTPQSTFKKIKGGQ